MLSSTTGSVASILITLIVVVFSIALYKWYKKVAKFSHLPSPNKRIPFLGHALQIPKELSKVFSFHLKMFQEMKSKIVLLWLTGSPLIGFYDVNIMEDLLKSTSYLTKGASYALTVDWLGTGLLTSDGEKWKTRRRLLTPAFHFGILKANASSINHHASLLIDYLKKKIKVEAKQDMQAMLKPVSLAVLCETAMGVRCNLYDSANEQSEETKYCTLVNTIISLHVKRKYRPWLHNRFIFKYFSSDGRQYFKAVNAANAYVRDIVQKRLSHLEEEGDNESSIFIDILLKAYKRNEIDLDGILEEVNTFMFAGHDTVSAALAWTLYLTGKDENIQNKLFAEVSLDSESFDKETVANLKYLDCVCKESLRLMPPAPIVARYFKEDAILGKDHKIPAGSTLAMHYYPLHRDESVWEKPTLFLPERFLSEKSEKKNPYAYLPFSAGPRNCIGQRFALLELKIVLCHLIKSFKFISLQDEKEMGIYSSGILRSKNGIWIEILER